MKFALLKHLKADQWWDYKLPPLLALAYYLLSAAPVPVPLLTALVSLFLFLVGSIGIAGFGHFLNDWSDMAQDRRAGAKNMTEKMSGGRRWFGLVVLFCLATVPWLFLPIGLWGWLLIAFEFLLFAAYSIPPIRLKERGLLGLVADTAYAHVIPFLVTYVTFAQLSRVPLVLWFGALLMGWSFALGMRHILQHQLMDLERDRRAGTQTFVTRQGQVRALVLATRVFVPLELAAFVGLVAVFSVTAPWLAVGLVVYLLWEWFKLRAFWLQPPPLDALRRDPFATFYLLGHMLLTRFYEIWLPLLLLGALALREPTYLVLVALHLVLFRNGLGLVVFEDVPLLWTRLRANTRGAAVLWEDA